MRVVFVVGAVIVLLVLLACIILLPDKAPGRELYPGQYADVPAPIQDWFKSRKNNKGENCCTVADGMYAEEDIRNGKYWTRWPGVDWMVVPDEAVINGSNPHGAPVVWWQTESGRIKIRCYVPGGKV